MPWYCILFLITADFLYYTFYFTYPFFGLALYFQYITGSKKRAMRKLPIIVLLIFLCISCQRKKESGLENSKNAIVLKDSVLSNAKSIRKWEVSLQGLWNSEMLCRKADCGSYVIGDRRNELWEFLKDSVRVYANGLNSKKLLSVFRAIHNGDKIIMESCPDSLSESRLKINVVLDDITDNVIKGTQTITTDDNCASVFDLELTRAKKR